MPSDVTLLSPEQVARLEARFDACTGWWCVQCSAEVSATYHERCATCGGDLADEPTREKLKALLLAARLLPQMAQALEAAEIALAPDTGQYVLEEFGIVCAALARYRAALGTAEEATDA